MAMIEFEDHCDENRRALLGYLERRRTNASFAPGSFLSFDMLVDPRQQQIGKLQVVPVLHEHVAVAADSHFR